MRILFTLICTLLITSCSTTSKVPQTKYISHDSKLVKGTKINIKSSGKQRVIYKGLINYDDIEVSGNNQLYPANSGAVFLASIFTHAAVVESSKKNKKNKIQSESSKISNPINEKIKDFTSSTLIDRAIIKLNEANSLPVTIFNNSGKSYDWNLSSKPVFYITKDLSTLVLKNTVTIHSTQNPKKIIYKNKTENISLPHSYSDPQELWEFNHGQPLKDLSIKLFAESLEAVIHDAINNQSDPKTQATFGYQLGDKKEYERGYLVNQNCTNTTIRTLRGWLKTFPNDNAHSNNLESLECS